MIFKLIFLSLLIGNAFCKFSIIFFICFEISIEFTYFSASRIIKKDIFDTSSEEHDYYYEDDLNGDDDGILDEQISEELEVQNHGQIIVKCLETVNEVKDLDDGLDKNLLMSSKFLFLKT